MCPASLLHAVGLGGVVHAPRANIVVRMVHASLLTLLTLSARPASCGVLQPLKHQREELLHPAKSGGRQTTESSLLDVFLVQYLLLWQSILSETCCVGAPRMKIAVAHPEPIVRFPLGVFPCVLRVRVRFRVGTLQMAWTR